MSGLLHSALVTRYGPPSVDLSEGIVQHVWRPNDSRYTCVLYIRPGGAGHDIIPETLRELYGNCLGGFLVGDSLKVALSSDRYVFGLYTLPELGECAEIRRAKDLDPSVAFFMDASNVWYYGYKSGRLIVYNSPFDELEDLGNFRSALGQVLQEWEDAAPESS